MIQIIRVDEILKIYNFFLETKIEKVAKKPFSHDNRSSTEWYLQTKYLRCFNLPNTFVLPYQPGFAKLNCILLCGPTIYQMLRITIVSVIWQSIIFEYVILTRRDNSVIKIPSWFAEKEQLCWKVNFSSKVKPIFFGCLVSFFVFHL